MTCDDDVFINTWIWWWKMNTRWEYSYMCNWRVAMVPRIIIQTGSLIKTGNCSLNRKIYIKEATISVTDVILRCICVIWISVSRVISSAVHHLIDRGCQIQSNRVLLSICRGYSFIESIEVMRATSFDVRQSDFTFNMQPYTKITSIFKPWRHL